ncbi:MAG: OB-fold nucleic acid binding domain-containing protein [Candidatus Bathyarchaeia archaeon]|nr:OB-fold nucleic acid binding domain-containing protein [Candidatus Bathyarchaeia archaeon]
MSIEKLIEQILSNRPEISRKELMERLKKAREKTAGFISDESLLRMIAAEFGIEISHKESWAPTLLIGDLVPGLNDVTVIGRVVAVFPSKIFKSEESGKFASLFVVDASGMLRVVLWNDKPSLIDSGILKVGQIIRFSHGYTRENRNGQVELHIGDKSDVQINPQDISGKDYPDINKFSIKIKEITKAYANKNLHLVGAVKEVFPTATFKKKDSCSGKVQRFILSDETGELSVVVWNEKVDELEKRLRKGVKLQIVNAKAKKAAIEGLEIHVDTGTYVEVLASTPEFFKIADLKEGLNHVNVKGEVATKPIIRNVKTSERETVKLAVFELKDETGKIWVSSWRKNAETAGNLKVGDKITIKNAFVKKGFGDQLEISTRSTTSIQKP